MASSAGYRLLDQASTDLDIEPEENETASLQQTSAMGKQLGTFRAAYVVALCAIGSFLFAYVSLLRGERCCGPLTSSRILALSAAYSLYHHFSKTSGIPELRKPMSTRTVFQFCKPAPFLAASSSGP